MNTARYYLALFLVVVMLPMPLFWFVIHPFIQVWRKAGPVVTYVVASSIWLGAAVALFLVRKDLLRIEYGTHSSSMMLGAVCLGFAFWMRLRIHRQVPNKFLAGLPELAPEVHPGRLETEGIYGRVRHPRYVQIMVALLGYALIANHLAGYLTVVSWLPAVWLIAILEEAELRTRFGNAYVEYCQKVPRFLPRFRQRR